MHDVADVVVHGVQASAPGRTPEETLVSTPHAAQTELYVSRPSDAADSLTVAVSVSVCVHGGTPGTRIVFRTSAESALVAMPLFDPESGQPESKTSVTPSPIRNASVPRLIFQSLVLPSPPNW